MSVPAAYLCVIAIWSTTPLTIQWSVQGMDFSLAVLGRMVIGLLTASALLTLGRTPFPLHRRACLAYVFGGLGLFASMALTYWGARYVHSGLISVLFGLSPLMAGVMASRVLGERALTAPKLLGSLLGLAGLATIFLQDGPAGGERFAAGLTALLAAVFLYSACLVGLKRIGDDSPPLATTVGSLAVATPLFALLWLLGGAPWPAHVPWRAGLAVVYLGVFGSAFAFTLYYHLIRHLRATRVALMTLVTPVLALLLGHVLNGEQLSGRLLGGSALILLGLLAHQADTWLPVLRQMRRS